MKEQFKQNSAGIPDNASEAYCKGFILGYSTGYRACADDIASDNYYAQAAEMHFQPLEALHLSSRSHHSLLRAGCSTIADVIKLSETDISQMRGLGKISANEIALRLRHLEISNTAWDKYIL